MSISGKSTAPLRSCNDGNALIEFAVIAPILTTLLLGMVDLGTMAYQTAALNAAARAGAEYARTNPTDPGGIVPTIVQRYGGPALSNVKVSPYPLPIFTECDNGTAPPCGSGPIHTYVTVTATRSFSPVLPFSRLVFPKTLTATVTTRVS